MKFAICSKRLRGQKVIIINLLLFFILMWSVWQWQDVISIMQPLQGIQQKFIESSSDQEMSSNSYDAPDWFVQPEKAVQIIRRNIENESAYFMNNPESVTKSYNFEDSQHRRKALLRHECQLDSTQSKPLPDKSRAFSKDLNHIIVVDCLRLVFCQVRKVSSVTWRMSLDDISKKLGCGAVRLFGSYSNAQKRRILQDYTKAIFVREPIERLVSAWRNKFRRGSSIQKLYGPMIIQKYRRQLLSAIQGSKNNIQLVQSRLNNKNFYSVDLNITFKEFASYLIDPEVSVTTGADMHWQDVYTRCAPCDISYDFIGHFETKTVDAQMLFKQLRAQVPAAFQLNHKSKTLDIFRRELEKFPKDMLYKLYTKYITDYKLFGYSWDKLTQFTG